jgi:hypothetical protein
VYSTRIVLWLWLYIKTFDIQYSYPLFLLLFYLS